MKLPDNEHLRQLEGEMIGLAVLLAQLPTGERLSPETLDYLDDIRLACGRLQFMAAAIIIEAEESGQAGTDQV